MDGFAAVLAERGLDLADYLLMPVHPWQWWNKLSVTFAAEVAQQRLVYLGEGDDAYLAQQSIRTFFNTADPAKHYVKTAISVLNMGFMRGLSAAYMEATPAINDWLAGLIDADSVFKEARFSIIRERAAVGYRHLEYEAATDRYSRTARCSPRSGASLRWPPWLPASGSRRWPRCSTSTTRARPSRAP